MKGYIKRFIGEDTLEGVKGKLYSVDFYLPGGKVVDWDQKFFVKDTEDVDVVLSKAYYDKQLYLISLTEVPTYDSNRVDEIQEPLPFTQFKTDKQFKGQSKETLEMLKNGEMPKQEEMPMSPEDSGETK